jgi:hypothetical protein
MEMTTRVTSYASDALAEGPSAIPEGYGQAHPVQPDLAGEPNHPGSRRIVSLTRSEPVEVAPGFAGAGKRLRTVVPNREESGICQQHHPSIQGSGRGHRRGTCC